MTKAAIISTLVLAGFGLAANATGAAARQVGVSTVPVVVNTAEAERLEREAESLFGTMKAYGRAARLMYRAATLRPDGDERALRDLDYSANLSFHAGNLGTAQSRFEETAARALRGGFVYRAAKAYIAAGYIAVARKQAEVAVSHFAAARQLAGSPHLDPRDRNALQVRLSAIPQTPTRLANVR